MGSEDTARSADPFPDVGELDVLESDLSGTSVETDAPFSDFEVEVTADFAAEPRVAAPAARQEIEVPELDVLHGGGAEVTEDGTLVADSVSVVYDEASGTVVIDEVVAVVMPDGTEIYDETVSVVDAEGEFRVVGEDVEVG